MTDIEKRFTNDGNDGSLIERQLFRRASVRRKSRRCPTENRVANLTPLRFGRYFNNNDSRFIASRVLKFDLIRNGSFEKPAIPDGSFQLFGENTSFSGWTVVGAAGNVGIFPPTMLKADLRSQPAAEYSVSTSWATRIN